VRRAEVHPAGEPVLIIFGSTTPLPFGHARYPRGHGLSQTDLVKCRDWLKVREACRARRPIIDRYATENSPLHSLHAREILYRKGIPAQARKAHQAIGPDVRC
jgi:hypothetical protein